MKKWMLAFTLLTISSQSFALRMSDNMDLSGDTRKTCTLESPIAISFNDEASAIDDRENEQIIITGSKNYRVLGIVTTTTSKFSKNMLGIGSVDEQVVSKSVVIVDDQGNEREIHPDQLTAREKLELMLARCK